VIETGPDEKIHPVAKLATIVEALAAEGVTLHDALRSIQLDASALSSPQTRVSLNQIIASCRNALSLSQDPLFAYHAGLRFHASTQGMYGFAILSSTDHRKTMKLAIEYHRLATPLADIAFREESGRGVWIINPAPYPVIDAALYRFLGAGMGREAVLAVPALIGTGALAEARLTRAESLLHGREYAHATLLLDWTHYQMRGCLHSLTAAHAELHRQVERLSDPTDRQTFLAGAALHRDIEAAWQTDPRDPRTVGTSGAANVVMALARADAPMGRSLEQTERVHVRLTIDAGPRDSDVFQREGKAGLRRHRLSRLIEQAHAQGAAPTDADLASALNVNIRTIERDMAALRSKRESGAACTE